MSRVAILTFREFDDAEVAIPAKRLRDAGHDVVMIGRRKHEQLRGRGGETQVCTDVDFEQAQPESFDALVIPGDEKPERLRSNDEAIDFVRRFWATGRPAAAIEEGVELLRVAGVLEGVELTSAPAFRDHLQGSGARWFDQDIVIGEQLVTGRNRAQVDAFCAALEAQLQRATEAHGQGANAAQP